MKIKHAKYLCNVRRPTPILVATVWRWNLDYAKNLHTKHFTGENIPIYGLLNVTGKKDVQGKAIYLVARVYTITVESICIESVRIIAGTCVGANAIVTVLITFIHSSGTLINV